MDNIAISVNMRERLADMQELYNAAKLNENAPQMEKLSKSMAGLEKQIKDQELHEKQTLQRSELKELFVQAGRIVAKRIKEAMQQDQEKAILTIELVHEDLEELAQVKDGS